MKVICDPSLPNALGVLRILSGIITINGNSFIELPKKDLDVYLNNESVPKDNKAVLVYTFGFYIEYLKIVLEKQPESENGMYQSFLCVKSIFREYSMRGRIFETEPFLRLCFKKFGYDSQTFELFNEMFQLTGLGQ